MSRINTGRPPYQKASVIRDARYRRLWADAHPFCAYCGKRSIGMHQLTCHHLIGGACRSDEATNLLRMGWSPCHQAAEGESIVGPDGDVMPTLTLAHCLWLKRVTDPSEFDLARLTHLYGQSLPEPQRPPLYRGPFGETVVESADPELCEYRKLAREFFAACFPGLSEREARLKLSALMGPRRVDIGRYSARDCDDLMERLRLP